MILRHLLILALLIPYISNSQTCYTNSCAPGMGNLPVVKAKNYPKVIYGNLSLTLDVDIYLPACFPTYTGRVVIVRMCNISQLTKVLDTIDATIISGTTIITNIYMSETVINEGVPYQDSLMNGINAKLLDAPNTCPDSYIDEVSMAKEQAKSG